MGLGGGGVGTIGDGGPMVIRAVIKAIALASKSCAACWIFGLFDAGGMPTDGTAANARSASAVADWMRDSSSYSGLMLAPNGLFELMHVVSQRLQRRRVAFAGLFEGLHQLPKGQREGPKCLTVDHR